MQRFERNELNKSELLRFRAEAADVLGISVRSAQDLWSYARTWLRRRMRSG